MRKQRRPRRNVRRCHYCFREVGCTKHGVMPFHKDTEGKRCVGTGRTAA